MDPEAVVVSKPADPFGDSLWNVGHKNAGGISEYIIPGGVTNPGMADCIYPIPADPPF